MNYNMIYW